MDYADMKPSWHRNTKDHEVSTRTASYSLIDAYGYSTIILIIIRAEKQYY
jgi:hypothetical protein